MMPSTELRNALPSAWLDKLFGRFSALYGKHWLDLWADVPMADVKDAWGEAIGNAPGEAIRRALDHCQTHLKFPPTAPEFAALCRDFRPTPNVPMLPAPRDHALGPRLSRVVAGLSKEKRDPKRWAHTVLAEAAAGTYRNHYGIELARSALGIVE